MNENSSWTFKYETKDLFFNPMVLTPVKINHSEINDRGYSDCPLFSTRQNALLNIQKDKNKLSIKSTIEELNMPTYASFKTEPLWKLILYVVFKTFFLGFIAITVPFIKWQITRFIKKTKKENPEWWC